MKKSAEKPLVEKFPQGVLNNKENKKNRDNESANKAVKLFNVNPHYIIDANTKKEKGSHATAKAVAKKLSEAVIK